MLNNYFKGLILFLILIFPLAANSQESNSDVEALKQQIEQMQKQNAEMIKKIQEQNAKQIYQLQKQINKLEKDNSIQINSSDSTVVIDEESLNKKIERSVSDNILT